MMMTREEYYAQIKDMYVQKYESKDKEIEAEDRRFREYLMLRNDDDDETWTWTKHYSEMDDETDLLEEESIPQSKMEDICAQMEDCLARISEELHALRLSYRSEKENPEDQVLNDEESVDTEVATESIETEHSTVKREVNAEVISAIVKEESNPQIQVMTVADSTCVQLTNVISQQVSISPLEYSLNFCKANLDVMGNCQYTMGKTHQIWSDSNFGCVDDGACQVFDEIPLGKGIVPKKHKKRFHKCWRFKFKYTAQPRGLIQEELCVQEANETMNQLKLPMHLERHILHQQLDINLCEYKSQILQLSNHDLETQMLPCLQRFGVVRMGRHVMFCLQELKLSWWVGCNEAVEVTSTKQELSYWSVTNDGCVILETNFDGFGRGKTEMLATSQKMQQMDLFSLGIHTVMEEDLKQQGNSEPLEIVPDVDAKVELVWESNSLVFHVKTRVWDPGRSLIEDATPREFPFHSTATISFSLLFFLSRITCKFSSLQTLRTRFP